MVNKRTPFLVLDFDNLNETSLKKLIDEFKKKKQVLVDLQSDNRTSRKDRQLTKKFIMFFDSGQSVTVTINETGDIFQTKLNSTIIPIDSPKSEREYATNVTKHIERNQARFEKSLAAKAQRAIKDPSRKRKASKTTTQLLNEVHAAHLVAKESVSQLENEKVKLHDKLLATNNQAADYRAQLEKEKAITNSLVEQLEELGVTPNV